MRRDLVLLFCFSTVFALDLPPRHLSIYKNKMKTRKKTKNEGRELPLCYGYENDCDPSARYEPNIHQFCSENEFRQFWNQGDFGYVKEKINNIFPVCSGGLSSLNCSRSFQFCKSKMLVLNLTNQKERRWPRHPEDIFNKGEIGGDCNVDDDVISRESSGQLSGGLRAWHAELKAFSKVNYLKKSCDIVVDKPVVFMKWDQGDNLYHRFCDFFNLYLSQIVNGTIDFNKDILIVKWDWSSKEYKDYFDEALTSFTSNPIVDIKSWFGKRICIPSAIFSFLPRMILGIYYNTPLGNNCFKSGLMKSFTDLFLHRMKIEQINTSHNIKRVTFLIRSSYAQVDRIMYRKIINLVELVEEVKSIENVQVQVVDFDQEKISFRKQLTTIHNTDILVSIHGAGLTHLLFLPDSAVVFEIFDCEAICYRDLARLRGVPHVTWEDQSKLEKHAVDEASSSNLRYYNYSFDRREFKRLFMKAKKMLEKHDTITHNEL